MIQSLFMLSSSTGTYELTGYHQILLWHMHDPTMHASQNSVHFAAFWHLHDRRLVEMTKQFAGFG